MLGDVGRLCLLLISTAHGWSCNDAAATRFLQRESLTEVPWINHGPWSCFHPCRHHVFFLGLPLTIDTRHDMHPALFRMDMIWNIYGHSTFPEDCLAWDL